jgi:allantoate deiminase
MSVPATIKNRTARARAVVARCEELAKFSEDANSLRRTFLSAPMRDCHAAIAGWLNPLGVSTTIDAVGNLRGLYAGLDPSSPRLLVGSHLDTVPNAGIYDGMLGVVLAIALLEELDGKRLPFAIEVVGFSEEEGVRFGVPFIGSRALVGRAGEDLWSRRDPNGATVRDAIRKFGLDETRVGEALVGEDVVGYLEFHIEQGPVLEKLGRQLGAVETLVGQSRLALQWFGSSNHAGTTPMDVRRDALAGAAEWMVAVEARAKQIPGFAATVGSIEAKPGAINVIPGEVRLTLDVRHKSDEERLHVVQEFTALAQIIAERRALSLKWITLLEQNAVAFDPFLTEQIEIAIRNCGCEPHRMTSGAGHDAMVLAERVRSAMVFLRSPGGISHDPAETVLLEDVEKAIDCGVHLLTQLASSPKFLGKVSRA